MASIASVIAQGPRPTNFGILTPNDQASQTNALAMQRQQIALEEQRVQAAKDDAIARARAIKDAEAYTDAIRAGQEEFDRSRRPAPAAAPQPDGSIPAVVPVPASPASTGNSIASVVATPPVPGETPANNAAAAGAVPQSQNSLAGLPAAPANPRPDEMTDRAPEPAGNSVAAALAGPPKVVTTTPAPVSAPARQKPMSRQDMNEFTVRRMLQNGASGATVDAFRKSQLALDEGAAKLDAETIKNRISIGLQAGEIFAAAMKAPPELWPQSKARLEQLEPGIQLPEAKPTDDQLNLLIAHNGYTLKHLQALEAEKKPAETQARTEEATAKAEQAQRANLASEGEEMARRGEVSYNDWFKGLTPKQQKGMPDPRSYDQEETPQLVRNAGLTAEQKTQADLRQMRQEALERHQKAMEGLGMKRNETLAGKNGLMSASAMTQAHREVDDAIKEERKLRSLRSNLGTALLGGNTYVNRLGDPVPIGKASEDNDKTKAELIADMEARYRSSGDDYADILRNKYGAGARLGMSPTVPLTKALGDISEGDKTFWAALNQQRNPGAAPAPQAAPAPAAVPVARPAAAAAPAVAPPAARPAATAQPKVANAAQVNAYAQKKGITAAQAAQEFKQFGYTIQ